MYPRRENGWEWGMGNGEWGMESGEWGVGKRFEFWEFIQ